MPNCPFTEDFKVSINYNYAKMRCIITHFSTVCTTLSYYSMEPHTQSSGASVPAGRLLDTPLFNPKFSARRLLSPKMICARLCSTDYKQSKENLWEERHCSQLTLYAVKLFSNTAECVLLFCLWGRGTLV